MHEIGDGYQITTVEGRGGQRILECHVNFLVSGGGDKSVQLACQKSPPSISV